MSKFLASAVFSGGITVAMYDGRTPEAVVLKTGDGDEKQRRPSSVLETHQFGSRAQMRQFVAGFKPDREAR